MQIGVNLKKFRTLRGLSQQKVADEIAEKRSTYAEWEQGTDPKASVLVRLAKVFGVTVAELLEEKDEISPREELVSKISGPSLAPHDQLLNTVQILTHNNDSLIKQHDKIISANAVIAETNRMLAEQLIKERPTAGDVVQTQIETVAIVKVLQEHIFDLEVQATGKNIHEIKQDFYSKVKAVKDPIGKKGSRVDQGT
jgi:transcriptional regulator with XRE-family HTH domain